VPDPDPDPADPGARLNPWCTFASQSFAGLVGLVGITLVTLLEWPAFAVYVVGFAGILAYFAALAYVEDHPRGHARRR